MAAQRTSVAVLGWGPIGRRIGARVLARPETLMLVAVVDKDPSVVGEVVVGTGGNTGLPELRVRADLPAAPGGGAVLVQATTSDLQLGLRQALDAVGRGWNVVSTCERMSAPRADKEDLASDVDAAAISGGVSVLAAGINPGFIMDVLPVALTTMCTRVDGVKVVRVVDTNARREQLQRKAGVGMTVEQFAGLARSGGIGHVGLRQSVQLIADRLRWSLDSVEISLEPVTTDVATTTALGNVGPGSVIGQHQVAVGRSGGKEVVRLDLEMSAGARGTDEVWIGGEPSIHEVIEGGVNGDIGTEAVIANLIAVVAKARPGLLEMTDVVPIGCDAG
jgi:hypothetical protein